MIIAATTAVVFPGDTHPNYASEMYRNSSNIPLHFLDRLSAFTFLSRFFVFEISLSLIACGWVLLLISLYSGLIPNFGSLVSNVYIRTYTISFVVHMICQRENTMRTTSRILVYTDGGEQWSWRQRTWLDETQVPKFIIASQSLNWMIFCIEWVKQCM